ncbi:MAG: glycosyltransferase family 4 protein [Rhodothermales bacterium]
MSTFADSTRPLRLGVWASDGDNVHFLDPILQRLPDRYEVHTFSWSVTAPAEEKARQLAAELQTVDIAWFEWATGPVLRGSQWTKDLPTVCRLHRYEAYGAAPRHIRWENVDRLIFIAKGVEETFQRLHKQILPALRVTEVIPNGIAVDEYPLKQDKERGYNLGFLARLNIIKNPMMLIQLMARLVKEDPRYTLHIAGAVREYVVMQYLEYHVNQCGLSKHFRFHGALNPAQVKQWLAKQHYILSTSVIEGHPVGVMEAMSVGLKPIIHDYVGARDIFPDAFLFNTIDEAVAMILSEDYEPVRYRQFIEENYTVDRQVEAVTRVLDELVQVYYPERRLKTGRAA